MQKLKISNFEIFLFWGWLSMEEGFILNKGQRSSLLLGGKQILKFLAVLAILRQDELKNRLVFTWTSWRIGCKSAYSLTCPGAEYQARQGIAEILFPKKQRRPLPSPLYKSFFYSFNVYVLLVYISQHATRDHRVWWRRSSRRDRWRGRVPAVSFLRPRWPPPALPAAQNLKKHKNYPSPHFLKIISAKQLYDSIINSF